VVVAKGQYMLTLSRQVFRCDLKRSKVWRDLLNIESANSRHEENELVGIAEVMSTVTDSDFVSECKISTEHYRTKVEQFSDLFSHYLSTVLSMNIKS